MDNIYEYNGIAAMAYKGEKPWHGKGQVILPTDTPEEIIKKSGFDFDIVHSPAGYMDERPIVPVFRPLPSRSILYRTDTGAPISVMSKRFKVHQPKEIMGFFLDFAKQFNISIETAGVLGGGERYWALARTGVDADLNGTGKDIAHLYALLATAVDGSLQTIATPTGVRVVCANTWAVAINGAQQSKSGLKQSHRSAFSNKKAAEGLGFNLDDASSDFAKQAETIRQMNDVTVDGVTAANFFRVTLRPEMLEQAGLDLDTMTADEFNRAFGALRADLGDDHEVRGVAPMLDAYANAPGARPGTLRGLWEATTRVVDHVRGKDDDGRMVSATTGQGADIKARAWANATRLLAR